MTERMSDERLAEISATELTTDRKYDLFRVALELRVALKAERAEVERLEKEVEELKADLETYMDTANSEMNRAEGLQAKIDVLMLAYCPDEMTPEQIEEWGRHQVPASQQENDELQAALADTPEKGE